MLLNANAGTCAEIPQRRQEELSKISSRMLPSEWEAMRERIRQWATNIGFERRDFFASNWKTSKDWQLVENGIFQPLYSACNENFEYAGHMFGWLVRSVMIEVGKSCRQKRRVGNVQKPRSGISGTIKIFLGNVLLEERPHLI